MKITIHVATDEALHPKSSWYKFRAMLKNLELISVTPGEANETVITAQVKVGYARCSTCHKVFRSVKGGGPVRHYCIG